MRRTLMYCAFASATSRLTPWCFALLLAAGCATKPAQAPEPTAGPDVPAVRTEAAPPPPVPAPAATPGKPTYHISIASVGDMMLGTDYPENHLPDDDGAGFLAGVTDVLSAADLALGNLEGVLADGGEPAKQCISANSCFLFRSPTRYAALYRAAGFDVLSLANNHARDFGEAGRSSTMGALDTAGILHSGREGDFASFELAGLRVAFLAYAVTRDSNLLHDYELAVRTVADFAATHDIVIVSFHGGAEGANVQHLPFAEEEYFGEPRGDVVRFARSAVDAGADLVIGHGPHVVRAAERYKDRLIAYSLGNFATYYGISVEGQKGIAPILVATLDADGRFVEGRVVSTEQIRPAGPSIDPQQKALALMRSLTQEDLGSEAGLVFESDGRILPAARPSRPQPSP